MRMSLHKSVWTHGLLSALSSQEAPPSQGEAVSIDEGLGALQIIFVIGSVGGIAFLLGFFVGVRAEATQGTFHDSYLKDRHPKGGRK